MKTFLKYSGILAAVVAIVGFILMMTTPAFFIVSGDKTYYLTGAQALFGEEVTGSIGGFITLNAGHINAVWSATLGWILAIVGIIALICGVVLPLLKLEKFAALVNIIALAALLLAGVFVFVSQPCTFTLKGASEASELYKDYALNATWVIAGILYLVAGGLAILPTAMDIFGGKKKK